MAALNVVNSVESISEDAQLLRRIAQKDRHAFSQFYDRYADVLYSMAMRVLRDPEEAADVLQEVFVQIWDKSHTYNFDFGKPFSWAVTLTRNKAIDRLRSRRRQFVFLDDFAQETADPKPQIFTDPEAVDIAERARLVRSAMETLPLEQRQAIEMAFLGGMTQNEISAALAQPLGTIKARIRRGMLKLRDTLKG